MRLTVACVFVLGLILLRSTPAHAIAGCFSNQGMSPAPKSVLPPRLKEVFDALSIELPAKSTAISANVKIRRDSQATWSELITPVAMYRQAKQPQILLGELGCSSNYSVAMLTQGVDIEVTLNFPDGSTLALADLPKRVTLPPKQL